MTELPRKGDIVEIPYGFETARGRILDVYGPPGSLHALVALLPDGDAGEDEEEPTTISVPVEKLGGLLESA